MIIHSYENSARADSCIDYVRASDKVTSIQRLILLPIPSTRDKCTILNTNIYINSLKEWVCDGDFICGYGLPADFTESVTRSGALVLDLCLDEKFLLENSYLTALCTLGIILNTENKAPCDLSVGIVGYGRIGARLTELLLYLGVDVSVYTTRRSIRNELCECGVSSVSDSQREFCDKLDILINTAPAQIFSSDDLSPDLRVIDLASGENFATDVGVEKYPSVPAKMFPVSSGRAWGRAIERFLLNKHNGG